MTSSHRQLLLGLCALVAAMATPGAASATTIAQPGASTAVREEGGTIVFSEYDRTAARWYLAVRNPGGPVQRLSKVPAARQAFDADIGTDTNGRPELVYRRCSGGTTTLPTGCDLYVYSLAAPSGERPVKNANDPGHNDLHPTLWRGRVVWTRVYGPSTAANPVVYTKTLTAPRSQPSTRLPGVPQQRCGDVENVCGPTNAREVEALELRGDWLGLIVRYGCNGCSGISQTEVRLDAVAARTSARIALQVSGLNGQQFVGPSLADGRLAWYRACAVNEAGCRTLVGPWRYGLSARTYAKGPPGPQQVQGFADSGQHLYEVTGCNTEVVPVSELGTSCVIDSIPAPTYAATPAPTG